MRHSHPSPSGYSNLVVTRSSDLTYTYCKPTPYPVWLLLCIMLCVSLDGAICSKGLDCTALVKLDPECCKLLAATAGFLLADLASTFDFS